MLFYCNYLFWLQNGENRHSPRNNKEKIMEIDGNVAANTTEEVATPLIDSGSTETNTDVPEGTTETPVIEDVTTTQAFSKRLKEMTQKGIDAHYDKLYGVSNNVHSEADFNKAMEAQSNAQALQDEEDRKANLAKQGVSAADFDEYIANNPTVKKYNELITKQELKDFSQKDNQEFLDYFQKENNRPFDSVKDILPPDVWSENKKFQETLGKEGKSFIDAYQKHENAILKTKLAEFQKGTSTSEVNTENATSTTGSVIGNGSNNSTSLTAEMIENMKPTELMKRWNEVKQVMKMK
jgi:hypothetical protein